MGYRIKPSNRVHVAAVFFMLLLALAGCSSPLDGTGRAQGTETPGASGGSSGSAQATATVQPPSQLAANPTATVGGSPAGSGGTTTGTSGGTSAGTTSGGASAQTYDLQQSIINVADRVRPAVVTVVNKLGGGPQGGYGGEALGTGMIVDQQGHIFTNQHVISGSTQGGISVIFSDGTNAPATLIGADNVTDIAVLQVNHPVTATVTLGDYSQVKVGQIAIAIGSALGTFEDTVTMGVVSGLNRTLPGTVGADIEPMIQTDAAINHGNSGGPLLDINGNVIGMNTAAIMSTGTSSSELAQGLGFAIPSSTLQKVTSQILKTGNVARPYLGVATRPISPQLSSYYGLVGPDGNPLTSGELVVQVEQGSAAAAAGLQPGDVITAVDGTEVNDSNPLANLLLNHNPGDKVSLTVIRNGKSQTLQATLGTRPASTNSGAPGGNGGSTPGVVPGIGTPVLP